MDTSVSKECFHLVLMFFLYNQVGFRAVGMVAEGRAEMLNLVPPLSQLFTGPCTSRVISIPDLRHIRRVIP